MLSSHFRIKGTALVTLFALTTLCVAVEAGSRRSGKLLIVVPTGFNGTAPMVEYEAAKAAQGLTVAKYVVPTGTSRATIKSYIEGLWGTANQPDYILLVGDEGGSSSTSNTIPYWDGTGSKGAATDWPYGCMPGGVSYYPDIPVGRYSAANTTQLQNMVDKTLVVESGVYADPDYVRRAGFLAQYDTAGLAVPTHTWIIDNYLEPLGFDCTLIDDAAGGNTADITNTLNEGCLFFTYMGHSGSSHWYGLNFDFSQSNVNALSNTGMYGLVCGWSCNTSNYPYDECIGETWLRAPNKGAAVYISASTFIYWGSYDDWIMSAEHTKAAFASFFEDNIWEVGPAWVNGFYRFLESYGNWDGDMNHLPSSNESVCHNFLEEFVILGDPSLVLGGAPTGLIITPRGSFEPEGQTGGPFTPDSIQYTMDNYTGEVISYEVTKTQPWLTITNGVGTIPKDGTAIVTVSVNSAANGYPDGSYLDTIEFVNYTTHEGDTTRPVVLKVGVPVVQYSWDMNSNPGWTTQGQWAYGHPTGGGGEYGCNDPSNGYTGSNVYGYNLSGDYANSIPEYHLTTTAIDCSDLVDVSLKFQRWLGVETPTYDHASIRVSNDGSNWEQVWANSAQVADGAWVAQEFDISDYADEQGTVYVRWTMGTTDSAWRFCGWNIDDVEIWGRSISQPIVGDVDDDGDVDLSDLAALLASYDLCAGDAGYNPQADFEGGDDCVTLADLAALLSNYGFGG